jgi:hypothetical protein
MSNHSFDGTGRPASSGDVRRVLGDLDDAKVTAILTLKPSLADLEDAAICMAGDQDILAGSGHQVAATASRIIELLAEEEEADEEPQSGSGRGMPVDGARHRVVRG